MPAGPVGAVDGIGLGPLGVVDLPGLGVGHAVAEFLPGVADERRAGAPLAGEPVGEAQQVPGEALVPAVTTGRGLLADEVPPPMAPQPAISADAAMIATVNFAGPGLPRL